VEDSQVHKREDFQVHKRDDSQVHKRVPCLSSTSCCCQIKWMTSSVHPPSVRAGLGRDDHLHRVLLLLPDIKVTEILVWLTSNISFLCHCTVRGSCGGGGAGDTGAGEDDPLTYRLDTSPASPGFDFFLRFWDS